MTLLEVSPQSNRRRSPTAPVTFLGTDQKRMARRFPSPKKFQLELNEGVIKQDQINPKRNNS